MTQTESLPGAEASTHPAGPPEPAIKQVLSGAATAVSRPILAMVVALIIGAIVIAVLGTNPLIAYGILLSGAFKGWSNFLTTLQFTTPLIFTGLAVAFSFRAGIWNIGAEGQMLFGAFFAAEAGFLLHLPPYLEIPFAFLAGVVGAVAWALIPGLLRALLGINELVICLMLNPIALLITSYFSDGPLKAPGPTNKTFDIQGSAQLIRLASNSQLNAGIIIAVLLAIGLLIYGTRTAQGYQLKMIGLNPLFAQYAGLNVARSFIKVMIISGAIAGLAGVEEALGVYHAYYDGFSPGYGFDGIAIAMLAKNNPLGVVAAALVFGALNSGGQQLQVQTNITKDLVTLLQAVIIFFLAAEFSFAWWRRYMRGRSPEAEAPPVPTQEENPVVYE